MLSAHVEKWGDAHLIDHALCPRPHSAFTSSANPQRTDMKAPRGVIFGQHPVFPLNHYSRHSMTHRTSRPFLFSQEKVWKKRLLIRPRWIHNYPSLHLKLREGNRVRRKFLCLRPTFCVDIIFVLKRLWSIFLVFILSSIPFTTVSQKPTFQNPAIISSPSSTKYFVQGSTDDEILGVRNSMFEVVVDFRSSLYRRKVGFEVILNQQFTVLGCSSRITDAVYGWTTVSITQYARKIQCGNLANTFSLLSNCW